MSPGQWQRRRCSATVVHWCTVAPGRCQTTSSPEVGEHANLQTGQIHACWAQSHKRGTTAGGEGAPCQELRVNARRQGARPLTWLLGTSRPQRAPGTKISAFAPQKHAWPPHRPRGPFPKQTTSTRQLGKTEFVGVWGYSLRGLDVPPKATKGAIAAVYLKAKAGAHTACERGGRGSHKQHAQSQCCRGCVRVRTINNCPPWQGGGGENTIPHTHAQTHTHGTAHTTHTQRTHTTHTHTTHTHTTHTHTPTRTQHKTTRHTL